MTKSYVDIAFIVPLHEEFERLISAFPVISQEVVGTTYFAQVQLPNPELTAVAFLQEDMGKSAAIRTTEALLSLYDVGIVIVVGIAGGLSGDVALGDVCFTGNVIDVLDNAKITDGKKGSSTIEFNTKFYNTDSILTFSIRYVKIGNDIKPHFEDWQLSQYYQAKTLVDGEFIGRSDKNEVISIPSIHDGSIVCGAVSKSDVYKSNLKAIDRKVLAIETESGGVFHSAQSAGVPAVSIRGICDYSDKNKAKLEEQTTGCMRRIAIANAVSFISLQLSNPQFLRQLSARREIVCASGDLLLGGPEDSQYVADLMINCRDEIHLQLTNLSPEYKGKPKGYRLPLPRARLMEEDSTLNPGAHARDKISILEAIAANTLCSMELPRNYPDNSLPWIVANELLSIEVDGKQAIPIVMDGENLKPPHGNFSTQTSIDLARLNASASCRPVFIIANAHANSRPRVDLIVKEMGKYGEARFVIINRNEQGISKTSELISKTSARMFNVCEISFSEMTDFFRRSFEMEDQEAGVVALKLHDMFKKFELNAHPSYFAGVGSDVIMALLRANKRSELIQLAVTGFLSFVVASDSDDIVLSRTTRESFLRQLSFAKNVEKKSFDRSSLVSFVIDFAESGDYDIDPISFIGAFQEKGIIYFADGKVEITLPFIESYLLAAELVSKPEAAKAYFDHSDPSFDFSTFDIYAELGPDSSLVEDFLVDLNAAIEDLPRPDKGKFALLTDEIRPDVVNNRSRLQNVQKRLKSAFEDVTSNRPNSREKQKLLDVAARVEESARSAKEDIFKDSGDEKSNSLERLESPLRMWSIAIMLLGSGSEKLLKAPKRNLAHTIVRSTSLLLDELLKAFPREEFEQFKKTVSSEEELRSILDVPEGEEIDKRAVEFVTAIMDAYEFTLLGYPIRAMFGQLGNVAGQRVLFQSVSSVETTDTMDNLVARIWSAEISAKKGKNELIEAIRRLPPTPFLRLSLSIHFMERVFWNHWETENGLALLDAAEESIRPLGGGGFDRGQIVRIIEGKGDAA